jgi:hypothetical protein
MFLRSTNRKKGKNLLDSSRKRWDDPIWWFLPLDGEDMLRVNMFAFYGLGRDLRFAEDVDEGEKYGDVWNELDRARDAVIALLENKVVPIKTCRAAGQEVIDQITKVVPADYVEASKKDRD